jgi:transcriptional regulator with PAS, ATPase and Fis domain
LFSDLVGHDAGLANAVNTAKKAASSDIPVFISGETGAGKEMFARAIHGESKRAGHPFVAINCGALPEKLIESILFGHEKGAFTGAVSKSIGKFREANGGSIFLDEVGELPMNAQVKLLRVLQQKEVEPVGATKEVPVNVRIISATNRNLLEEVKAGNFREDLYFRLNVLQIELPSLKDRSEDILKLSHHFIESHSVAENRMSKQLSEDAKKFLKTYSWHGNVRELENIIHRAVVLSTNDIIDVSDLTEVQNISNIYDKPTRGRDGQSPFSLPMFRSDGKIKTISSLEKEIIQFALKHYDDNITQASKALGIAKSTLYRKLSD